MLARDEWEPLREGLRLGVFRQRRSKTAGREYWSQGCADCDALFGQWPIRKAPQEAATTGWDGVRRVGLIVLRATPSRGGRQFEGPDAASRFQI